VKLVLQIYYVSRTRVTFAKKQFSNVNHDYELTLEASSEVRPCNEDASIPTIRFDFVKIADIMQHEKDANIGEDNYQISRSTIALSKNVYIQQTHMA
jgi:ssDNA-binding replication factor A large subunit